MRLVVIHDQKFMSFYLSLLTMKIEVLQSVKDLFIIQIFEFSSSKQQIVIQIVFLHSFVQNVDFKNNEHEKNLFFLSINHFYIAH